MPDTSPPSESAPAPAPRGPVPRRSRAQAATPPPPPTPPGPVAGMTIGPVTRKTSDDLPPGIPPQMAGMLVPRRVAAPVAPAAAKAPEVPLHPSFAGPDATLRRLRTQAEALRTTAQGTATSLRSLTSGLKAQTEAMKATPEGRAAAANEGLDLDLLSGFITCLDQAVQITEPPTSQASV